MTDVVFICYPKCSTCKKAQAWLTDHGIEFTVRDIVTDNPQAAELRTWHHISRLPIRRFFNTSGMIYREQNIKEKLDAGLSDEDAYELLATNGMLVKRPIIVGKDVVVTGFREADWERALL